MPIRHKTETMGKTHIHRNKRNPSADEPELHPPSEEDRSQRLLWGTVNRPPRIVRIVCSGCVIASFSIPIVPCPSNAYCSTSFRKIQDLWVTKVTKVVI